MVYTVTLNPSLDYVVHLERLEKGVLNRTQAEEIQCGGKGVNVSVVLSRLGVDTTALGFAAGFTGMALKDLLRQTGINEDLMLLPQGHTRINLKIKAQEETEINAQGPEITHEHLVQLMEQLKRLQKGDVLVLAGSVPKGLGDTVYADLVEMAQGKGGLAVVDAEGALLTNTLECRPFLIKPNHLELGHIFGKTLKTKEEVEQCAQLLQKKGARNILVSMAAEGALLLDENGSVYHLDAPVGTVKNSVGAGDSMVAGFLFGWLKWKNYFHALCMGVAAGSACAFSRELPSCEQIENIFQTLTSKK